MAVNGQTNAGRVDEMFIRESNGLAVEVSNLGPGIDLKVRHHDAQSGLGTKNPVALPQNESALFQG